MRSHAQKGTVRYRYSAARAVGLDGKRLSLPAAPIEAAIVAALRIITAPSPAPLVTQDKPPAGFRCICITKKYVS